MPVLLVLVYVMLVASMEHVNMTMLCNFTVSNLQFDLTPLVRLDGPDYYFVQANDHFSYVFNPCSVVHEPCSSPSVATPLCQSDTRYNNLNYSLGAVDGTFSALPASYACAGCGVSLTYQHGTSCGGGVWRTSTINFLCSTTTRFEFVSESITPPCSYLFNFWTPSACALGWPLCGSFTDFPSCSGQWGCAWCESGVPGAHSGGGPFCANALDCLTASSACTFNASGNGEGFPVFMFDVSNVTLTPSTGLDYTISSQGVNYMFNVCQQLNHPCGTVPLSAACATDRNGSPTNLGTVRAATLGSDSTACDWACGVALEYGMGSPCGDFTQTTQIKLICSELSTRLVEVVASSCSTAFTILSPAACPTNIPLCSSYTDELACNSDVNKWMLTGPRCRWCGSYSVGPFNGTCTPVNDPCSYVVCTTSFSLDGEVVNYDLRPMVRLPPMQNDYIYHDILNQEVYHFNPCAPVSFSCHGWDGLASSLCGVPASTVSPSAESFGETVHTSFAKSTVCASCGVVVHMQNGSACSTDLSAAMQSSVELLCAHYDYGLIRANDETTAATAVAAPKCAIRFQLSAPHGCPVAHRPCSEHGLEVECTARPSCQWCPTPTQTGVCVEVGDQCQGAMYFCQLADAATGLYDLSPLRSSNFVAFDLVRDHVFLFGVCKQAQTQSDGYVCGGGGKLNGACRVVKDSNSAHEQDKSKSSARLRSGEFDVSDLVGVWHDSMGPNPVTIVKGGAPSTIVATELGEYWSPTTGALHGASLQIQFGTSLQVGAITTDGSTLKVTFPNQSVWSKVYTPHTELASERVGSLTSATLAVEPASANLAGVRLIYKNGDPCETNPNFPKEFHVVILCDADAHPDGVVTGPVAETGPAETDFRCVFEVTVRAPSGCAVAPARGGNRGTAAAVAFGVILALFVSYCFIGAALNYRAGKRGHQIVPHHKFWLTCARGIRNCWVLVCTGRPYHPPLASLAASPATDTTCHRQSNDQDNDGDASALSQRVSVSIGDTRSTASYGLRDDDGRLDSSSQQASNPQDGAINRGQPDEEKT